MQEAITEGESTLDLDPLLAENQPNPETVETVVTPQEIPQSPFTRCAWASSWIASPFTDDTGSGKRVAVGLTGLGVIGCALGLVLPKNDAIPTPWYRTVSAAIGYTYFIYWSVSFYPQVVANYMRKSTQGLSSDFCGLNVIGFGCYTTYTASFFFSRVVQEKYRDRFGPEAEITIQSNDVAFAVHALILSSITFLQIGLYDGWEAMLPTFWVGWAMRAILVTCLGYIGLVLAEAPRVNLLDFLYLLSFVKILISLIKYIPQVILNYQRKSTAGWSIWNVLLDFSGGVLSDLQLVFDCADMGDWTGITGNFAKFGLGFVSILFDIIFMAQHYVLYGSTNDCIIVAQEPATEENENGP